jgi:hypothetical protein
MSRARIDEEFEIFSLRDIVTGVKTKKQARSIGSSCLVSYLTVDGLIRSIPPSELLLRYRDADKYLVEGVGAGAPVGEGHAEADSLEYAGGSTDGNGVKRTLLGDNLGDDLWRC